MRTHVVTRLALSATLALLIVSSAQADNLRWKFKTDEPLSYVLERKLDGKINLSGAEIAFTLEMIFDTTWKATAVADDGDADVALTVDRIQITMNSPLFGKMAYDSTAEKEPEGQVWQQMKPTMTAMLGQEFTVKVSPLGAIEDIQLPKKLADALAQQEIGENRRQGFGIGGNSFNEKGIKELITKAMLPLPEEIGEDTNWMQTFENDIPQMGKQITETTFTVAGVEKKDGKELTKISAVTELLFEPSENPRADLEIIEQDASATIYFDGGAGHLVKSEGKQDVSMEITGPQEITQEMKEIIGMYLGKSPAKKPEEPAAEAKE